MDGCFKQNPAYRFATERPRSGGASPFERAGKAPCARPVGPIGYFPAVATEGISERVRERKSMFFAIAAVTLVTVAAAVGGVLVAIHDARTVPAHGPAGIKLTAAEVQGRKLFADTCATCHTLAAVRSVGRVGPNLDVLQPPASRSFFTRFTMASRWASDRCRPDSTAAGTRATSRSSSPLSPGASRFRRPTASHVRGEPSV